MKVAVVHEWLVTWAGSERVLAEIIRLFPEADLFVLFDRLPRDQRHHLPKDPMGQSFLQHVPFVEKVYRNLLPLMPSAIESLNLASYDLVLSSSHAVAKWILPSGCFHGDLRIMKTGGEVMIGGWMRDFDPIICPW